MTLKFQLDSLEGVEESVAALYVETGEVGQVHRILDVSLVSIEQMAHQASDLRHGFAKDLARQSEDRLEQLAQIAETEERAGQPAGEGV